MTAFAFLGERFSRTHENQAFDELFRLVKDYWQDSEERIALIGNVTCNGHELDAILLKPDAIAVIDFKNHGGKVKFSENGPWMADGKEVRGGAKTNPFKQLQANKFAVLNWLNDHCTELSSRNNLGHIAGLVLFQQAVEFDLSQLPGKVASWFHVADYPKGIEWLTQLASPGINLGRADQDQIIAALNVVSYQLADDKLRIREVPGEADMNFEPGISWTAGQRGALNQIERMLRSEEPQAMLVTGMASTGKTSLINALAKLAADADREVIGLAPNAPLANIVANETGQEFRSIYGHIYDLSGGVENDAGVLERPMRECKDSPDAVYIIDEGQLLSDAHFELGNERFGSGRLVSDFLRFTDFPNSNRRLVILGDPFQVFRSSQADSLITPDMLTAKRLSVGVQELDQLIDNGERSDILDTAAQLVGCQRQSCYHTLDICPAPPELTLLSEQDKPNAMDSLFGARAKDSMFITFSNRAAHQITRWIRQRVRGCKTDLPEAGDRIELLSLVKLQTDEDPTNTDFVPHGSFGTVVSCDSESIEKLQPLKGREQPVSLRFRRIRVSFDQNPVKTPEFLYFEPFLEAEKPELDQEMLLALRICGEQNVRELLATELHAVEKLTGQLKQLSKGSPDHDAEKRALDQAKTLLRRKRTALLAVDPYFNAARIRFAYATTCHHAQGRRWLNVLVDARYEDQGRDNEGYFRWLYTAITRGSSSVQIANFDPLSPLDKVTLDTGRTVVDPNMKAAFQFSYDKDKPLTEESLAVPAPKGLTNLQTELLNLWLELRERFSRNGLTISEVKQFPYQEQYIVEGDHGQQATLTFSYGKEFNVTGFRALKGDEPVIAVALDSLRELLTFEDPLAQGALEILSPVLSKSNLIIEGGAQKPWKLALTVSDPQSRKATLQVNYKKDGTISTIEVSKVTDAAILSLIEETFTRTGSPA